MSSLKQALTQLPEPTKTIGNILIEFYETMKSLESNIQERGGKQAVKIVMTISDIEKLIKPTNKIEAFTFFDTELNAIKIDCEHILKCVDLNEEQKKIRNSILETIEQLNIKH